MAPGYVKKLFKSIRNKYCTQSSYHNYQKRPISSGRPFVWNHFLNSKTKDIFVLFKFKTNI